MHSFIYSFIVSYTRTHTHIHIYKFIYIYIYRHTLEFYVYMSTYMSMFVCVYIYIYIEMSRPYLLGNSSTFHCFLFLGPAARLSQRLSASTTATGGWWAVLDFTGASAWLRLKTERGNRSLPRGK